MLLKYAASLLAGISLCNAAQSQSSATEPCAQVNSLVASKKAIPASVAEACALSVPIVEQDALDLIDGLTAVMQLQSTTPWLKAPPEGYQFPAFDVVGELSKLREQITNKALKSEILFERNISLIISQAHDGHLHYAIDGMSVFTYRTGFGSLEVASLDGKQTPGIYLHDDLIALAKGSKSAISAITAINDVEVIDWIKQQTEKGIVYPTYQDADALFNEFMYGPISPNGKHTLGSFDFATGVYRGEKTTLKFADGTTQSRLNFATTSMNFTGVNDGPSFLFKFCNSTEKLRQRNITLPTTSSTPKQTSLVRRDVKQLENYPAPAAISSDGSISGYFLATPGFEDTAVLVITSFPLVKSLTPEFQATLTNFLNNCRSQNKKRLVIDITNNIGGAISLVYEVFKQLFPNIEPYQAGNLRADDALNIIGKAVTTNAQKVQQDNPGNVSAYINGGGFSDFDARAYLNESGSLFGSWDEFYGPVNTRDTNFTNLFRWNYQNPNFTTRANNISISNPQQLGPQPFEAKNIIIVGDGRCQSSCTTLSHLLKWQGKVKSIAIGGRPQNGSMQSQGGVKGSQVASIITIVRNAQRWLTTDQYQEFLKTSVGSAMDKYLATMMLRTPSAGVVDSEITFNFKNNIAEGDASSTPLQFVYEAADCKLWNRPQFVKDPTEKWQEVVRQAWGSKDVAPWSGCVPDSTNHSTSLTGNPSLFNNGVANNVTNFAKVTSNTTDTAANKNDQDKSKSAKSGAGDRMASPVMFALAVAIAAVVYEF